MATGSSIEWTEATWNPVSGCTRASAGCDNCYAVTMTHRLAAMGQKKYQGLTVLNGRGDRHFNGKVRCHDDALEIPLRWKKPRRIFVNSMSDLFHKDVPFEFIDQVFAVMALTPQHTYQVLTKRPDRMAEYFGEAWAHASFIGAYASIYHQVHRKHLLAADAKKLPWPLRNVWLGTSVESQDTAKRAWKLLECPAVVRFLSIEPLIAPVDLNALELLCTTWSEGGLTIGRYLDWVIVGGESGPGARPCNVDWIRNVVKQCQGTKTPVFVKQLGAKPFDPSWHGDGTPAGSAMLLDDPKGGNPAEWPEEVRVRQWPKAMETAST